MFSLSRSARNSLLVILALLAIISRFSKNGDVPVPPSARIADQSDLETASNALPKPPSRPDKLVGDESVLGQIDLTTKELMEDRYQVLLPDGAKAILTLDPNWQKAADSALARAQAPQAAMVVMRSDGTILAMSGLRNGGSPLAKADPSLALTTWAPAASVFKVVTASALINAGVHPKTKLCYHGGLRSIETKNLSDNPRIDKSCNNLGFALAKSQNALLAKFSHRHLTPESLGAVARNFGFGKAPTFALKNDLSTIDLPTDRLEFARVAAGFWKTEISPLGGAMIANLIASGGLEVTPRIVEEIVEETRTIKVSPEAPIRVLPAKTANLVAEMMKGTVQFGTAYKGFHAKGGKPILINTQVAGKTGSLTRTTPDYMAFSWFVGFTNPDDPDIVIAVLLGNEAKWHLKAHTVARLALQHGAN